MARPVDNFDDNSIDTAADWAASVVNPYFYATSLGFSLGGTVAETNQRLELSPVSGVAGLSSLDTSIDDTNTDIYFKLTDLDAANMPSNGSLLFGAERSNASRHMLFYILNNFGTIQIEWVYLGGSGYIGTAPSVVTYSSTDHVWFRIRQHSGSSNDVSWAAAPAGANATTPGTFVEQRRLSTEGGWAAHLTAVGGTATAMNPAREGIWARNPGATAWVPKIDNFNFTDAGSTPAPRRTLMGVG